MAAVLVGVGLFVYVQLRGDLRQSVDMGLSSRAQVIVANAARGGGALGGGVRHHRLIDADEAYAQVLTPAGRIVATTAAVARGPLVGGGLLAATAAPRYVDRTPRGLDQARLLVVPTHVDGRPRFVVVGATMSNTAEALGRLERLFEVAIPAALLVSSLVGWLLAGAALRPVERMRREAEAISAARPGHRLAVPDTDDTLSRLARTLNATFDRLQEAHERERRFVDDASHELRTPLAILKAEVDTALADERDRGDLRRALGSAAEEIDHLVRIADGLLVLARANHGRVPIHRTDTPLAELVEGCASGFVAAAKRDVRLIARADDVTLALDRTRIRQALDNLIANAVRHTPPGGVVTVVAVLGEPGKLAITVDDTGPGFTAEALKLAFQPFTHAPDPHGGAGLGLAIVQAIAHAHGGAVHAENLADGGARVTLTVAASAAARPAHRPPVAAR